MTGIKGSEHQEKKVLCFDCLGKKPITIKHASFLVFFRELPYDFIKNEVGIDPRVVGVCKECLGDRNDFQKKNAIPVNADHPDIFRRAF